MSHSLVPPARLYALESMAEIRKSFRLPQFLLPTILLPVAFYGLFATAMGDGDRSTAAYALATFGVFAAIGPSLFGFGVGVADERAANLIELKRVSPLPGGAYIAGKIAASVLFTGVAVLLIYALGAFAGSVRLPAERWPLRRQTSCFSASRSSADCGCRSMPCHNGCARSLGSRRPGISASSHS